jgi:nitrite reductase (NO-forming)
LTCINDHEARKRYFKFYRGYCSRLEKETVMFRRHFGRLIFVISVLVAAASMAAAAQAPSTPAHTHEHGANRGTVEAPLSIARDPADVAAAPSAKTAAQVVVELETVEVTRRLSNGTAYHYWTFGEKVPGPFVRIRAGDTVKVILKNAEDSALKHSVDFHAVTGPGGGAAATQTAPGEKRSFTFTALNPGLYVYHCATPPVAEHIAAGMYGLILVEPKEGLPKVDHEFYVMQGEIYTAEPLGTKGEVTTSRQNLLDEEPGYFVFNGAVGGLTDEYPLKAQVGETVRIFFGVGGPNFTSSFHVIGEIFDTVYNLASLTAEPLTNVQTITVPPGGAAMVEFRVEVPGRYLLVDHALSRLERGLSGVLQVEGPARPEVYKTQ